MVLADRPDKAVVVLQVARVVRVRVRVRVLVADGGGRVETVVVEVGGGCGGSVGWVAQVGGGVCQV